MPEIKLLLNEILKDRRMTQTDLVHLTGIRSETISNLARGKNERVSLIHLAKIMQALELSDVGELLEFVPAEQEAQEVEDPLDDPLTMLDLPVGPYNRLRKNYPGTIRTVRDVLETDLTKVKGLGPKQRLIVEQALDKYRS